MHQYKETVYLETADSIFLDACPLFYILRIIYDRNEPLYA